jgi:uncharacterized membrane protein YhaH (DUF805 family)
MSFQDAIRVCLTQKYIDFTGRARRSEYWWFALFGFIVQVVVGAIDRGMGSQILGALISLALLAPSLAVAVRRLHDTSRSGWWLLLVLLPIIGWIVLLVFYLQDSAGPNAYGPSPKASSAEFSPM